jgi:photosystem II stability/assembly factor-like uncharacterized protein
MKSLPLLIASVSIASSALANAEGIENSPNHGLVQQSAVAIPGATDAMMLGAARAGDRVVAVGDHGIVLLSDDSGATYRQAKSVPTRATLTSVHFVDKKEGWAAGHWGVILRTSDGGESWTLQREDLANDRPLFSVWFKDNKLGVVCGIWGLVLRTEDGGARWEPVTMPPAPGKNKPTDLNLLSIFADRGEHLFIAAERGSVFRSEDLGAHWTELRTGDTGTFWTGIALSTGTVVVAGLRGHISRSVDHGAHWEQLQTGIKSSITSLAQQPNGGLMAVGLDGVVLRSADDGRSFTPEASVDREALTAMTVGPSGAEIVFSAHGPVSNGKTASAR